MKNINRSLLFALFIILVGSCNLNRKDKQINRPNIIFIMADDHAYQAISCYGDSINLTPNIDKLAESGVRFNNSFCTNSICAPSRAVMLTGTYSHINGHVDNYSTFDGSQQTFPKLLQKAGYQTAMIGKWHLKSDPTGFDYWNILPGQGHYYNPDFIENGVHKQIPGYVTNITTEIALQWLSTRDQQKPFCMLLHHKAPHRNWMPGPDQLSRYDSVDIPVPSTFFDDYSTRGEAANTQKMEVNNHLQMAYDLKLPEIYNSSTKTNDEKADSLNWKRSYNRMNKVQRAEWDEAYFKKNESMLSSKLSGNELSIWKYKRYMQDYLSCIASLDDNIGVLLDYLKEEKLLDNTIIIYTSDQGFYLGEHGWFDKRFMYEQSLRMPLIISYPKEISPSINEENMVLNLDFAPTILDFAGVNIPQTMQGRSLKTVLSAKPPSDWRDAVYYRYYEYPGEHSVKRHYGIRTDRYKLIHFYYDVDYWELYDIENDPLEVNNLYENDEYSELIVDLKSKIEELQEEYLDTDEDQFLPLPNIMVDHLAKECKVEYKLSFSEKYTAGGEMGLTDGVRANDRGLANKGYDVWQGYEGTDMEIIIDLGSNKAVNSISCGFLQKEESWIFLPKKVSYYVSKDGNEFIKLNEITTGIIEKNSGARRYAIETRAFNETIRYVKVVAGNIGICPEWHIGAGSKAWLFADEVVVK